MQKRQPCKTCPWRRSTPPRGFPGGFIRADDLLAMARSQTHRVMQCHCTPDNDQAEVCVGYARRCSHTLGVRLATVMGLIDPDTLDLEQPPQAELHDVNSLVLTHGGRVLSAERA